MRGSNYWRICPEELTAETVARTPGELDALYSDAEHKKDWEMASLVADLIESYGDPLIGECFGLTIPAVLGGEYSIDNISRRGLYEYLLRVIKVDGVELMPTMLNTETARSVVFHFLAPDRH